MVEIDTMTMDSQEDLDEADAYEQVDIKWHMDVEQDGEVIHCEGEYSD